jgi:hypothetical protein
MKKFVVLLLVGLMATTAFAQIDPDNDQFGVYFNTLATTVSRATGITGTGASAYLMLVRPTTAVKGFEVAYEITGWMAGLAEDPETGDMLEQGFYRVSQLIAGTGIVDLGNSTLANVGSFAVGYAAARPATPIMTLVTWRFANAGFMGVDPGLKFFLTGLKTGASPGANGYPMINSGSPVNPLRQAGVSSGSLTLPCAETNTNLTGVTVVAEEISSFGSVKSLFR